MLRVREDSDEGCGDPSCSNLANYITIDHGDGTVGLYLHLQYLGAHVEVGDEVVGGDVIGLSGNTGWSTGPHLHLEFRDLYRQSVPIRFEDLRDVSDGSAFNGVEFQVLEQQDVPQGPFEFSSCPPDAYGWMGVTLDEGFPCTLVEADKVYTLSGIEHGDDGEAKAGTWSSDGWSSGCTDSDADGRFAIDMQWPAEAHGAYSYLMVGASKGNCRFPQSWSDSIQVIVHE